MSTIKVPDISFYVYPKEKLRDKIAHSLLKRYMDNPSDSLYTPKTMEEVFRYLTKTAQNEGLQIRLELWDTQIHGTCPQSDFERFFGAEVRYRERHVQYSDDVWDTARYYEWLKQPSRKHKGIKKVDFDDIYHSHREYCDKAEKEGRRIIELNPIIVTR